MAMLCGQEGTSVRCQAGVTLWHDQRWWGWPVGTRAKSPKCVFAAPPEVSALSHGW
jgi:hypothetical protein